MVYLVFVCLCACACACACLFADFAVVKLKQGDDMSPIRRSVLEDLLRGRQSDLGFQELMLRVQSLE